MTIALGMMTGNSVILAADCQESDGYFKDFALKISSSMTHTRINATVRSALAITGAGPGIYLDAISDEITDLFHARQERDIGAFENVLKDKVETFYKKHVVELAPHVDREFRVIIGAQIEGITGLWVSDATVVKRIMAVEAVGTGAPFAKMALSTRYAMADTNMSIVLAILAVHNAREYDHYCGKGTAVVCLHNDLAYNISPGLVVAAEKLLDKYLGIEYSSFHYALCGNVVSGEQRTERIVKRLNDLRGEFTELAGQFLADPP
jgi:hypothetical protein